MYEIGCLCVSFYLVLLALPLYIFRMSYVSALFQENFNYYFYFTTSIEYRLMLEPASELHPIAYFNLFLHIILYVCNCDE